MGSTTDTFDITATNNAVENFTGLEFHTTQDTGTHEGIQDITDNLAFTEGTDAYTLANDPNDGSYSAQVTQNYASGQEIYLAANFDTRGANGVQVGDILSDVFEVTAIAQEGDLDYDSFTVKYIGDADNVAVNVFKDTWANPGKLEQQLANVSKNEEFIVTYGNRLDQETTLQVVDQTETTGVHTPTSQTLDAKGAGMIQEDQTYGDWEIIDIKTTGDEIKELKVEYVGTGQNIAVSVYRGDGTDPNELFNQFGSINNGDQFKIREGGISIGDLGELTIKTESQGPTVPPTYNLTEGVDYSMVGDTITLTDPAGFDFGYGLNTGADLQVDYQIGTPDHTYALSETPFGSTLEVRVDGVLQDEGDDYTYDDVNDEVTILDAAHGAAAQFDYDVGEYTDSVTLGDTPNSINSITVGGNPIVEDPVNGYTISGDDILFNGTAKPFYQEQIVIDYEIATTQDTFTLSENPNAGTATVEVNDVVIDPADYNIVGNTLTFTGSIPFYGDEVEVAYNYGAEDQFTLSDTPIQGLLGTAVVTVDGTPVAENGANGWTIAGDVITFNGTSKPDYQDDIAVSFDAGDYTDSVTLTEDLREVTGVRINGVNVLEDGVNGYSISGDDILFNGGAKPFYGDAIEVDYTSSTMLDTYLLADDPYEPAGMTVQVEGVTIDPADYNIHDGNQITFTANAPGAADAVQIDYQVNRSNTVFDLGNTPNAGTLEVTLDGVAVDPAEYTLNGSTLTFNGSVIPKYPEEVAWTYDLGEKLTEIEAFDAINFPPPNAGSLTVFKNGLEVSEDAVDGWQLSGDESTIELYGTGQGDPGDSYTIQYQIGDDVEELTLDAVPNAGSVEVLLNGTPVTEDAVNGWTVADDVVTLHGDAIAGIGDEFTVNFETGEPYTQMTLTPPDDYNPLTLKVWLNGERLAVDETNGYTVDGVDPDLLHFNGTGIPTYDDEILVEYGVGEVMDTIDLVRAPVEGSFELVIDGVTYTEDAINGFTLDDRTITLHGDAIPYANNMVEFTYDYEGGEEENFAESMVFNSGLDSEIDTQLSADLTVVGQQLDDIDLMDQAGVDAGMERVNAAIARIQGLQTVAGTQENQLTYTLQTHMDQESRAMAANAQIKYLDTETEMMNFTEAQVMSQLVEALLSNSALDPTNAMSLLMGSGIGTATSSFGF